MRRHLAVLVGLVIAAPAVGACGGTDTSSPTSTAVVRAESEERTSSTSVGTGTIPAVTRPAMVTNIEVDELPAKVRGLRWGSTVGPEERACADVVIHDAVENDPGVASDDTLLAGVTGASIVVCVPQEKVNEMLAERLADRASGEQIECVKQQVVTADPQQLAIFLGGLALDEAAVTAGVAAALDAGCGTDLARG